jgi:uncharacterized membrane protein
MSRYIAFLAYLLSVVGAVFVLLFRRNDRFAVFHAKQSLGLVLLAVMVIIIWAVAGWLMSWIPYIGFIFAMATFALVIASYMTLFISWLMGIKYALEEKMQPVPVIGGLIQRIFP